jgi:hypothetical protein
MTAPARFAVVIVLSGLAACFAASCERSVDLPSSLLLRVSSGWVDAPAGGGKTRLVPAISFTIRNGSDRTLSMLQVNALFRRIGDEGEWGSRMVTAAGTVGLAPGAVTAPLTAASPVGYTGTEPRSSLLIHSQFVDASVELFAKYGSANWKRLGRYPISRALLAP